MVETVQREMALGGNSGSLVMSRVTLDRFYNLSRPLFPLLRHGILVIGVVPTAKAATTDFLSCVIPRVGLSWGAGRLAASLATTFKMLVTSLMPPAAV